ncbi:Multiple PDZ domain [Paramuricea clavata]|nr:Multiple PDZ domain [Paramuricea clavata]
MQIDDTNVGTMTSEEVAQVLRQAGNPVRMVIARVITDNSGELPPRKPVETGNADIFEVELSKGNKGLGITIAGYVGEENEAEQLSGIFVRSISEDSAADRCGKINVNDQIIEVDGVNLENKTNLEAVEVLKKTGSVVRMKLARAKDVAIPKRTRSSENIVQSFAGEMESAVDEVDEVDNYAGPVQPEVVEEAKAKYQSIVGEEAEILVVQLPKFSPTGGLGLSLEGFTQEGLQHHRIHTVNPTGPVGVHGVVVKGDYLIEINGSNVLELSHNEVVSLIQALPLNFRLVVARKLDENDEIVTVQEIRPTNNNLNSKSTSSMWASEVEYVDLEKGEKGLGFSILDYQDPVLPDETVIVIRSLVPGGAAEHDGRLHPGHRLMSVNDTNLEHATLDIAVQTLKSTERGIVRIGVAKPFSLFEDPDAVDNRETSNGQGEEYEKASDDEQFISPHPLPFDIDDLPNILPVRDHLETIRIKRKIVGKLGISLRSDRDQSGCEVKEVLPGGAVDLDGRITVGDHILSVNDQSLVGLNHQQVKAILRKQTLLKDISFIVIKKQFLPPRLGSRSGEDSLASSTLSLVTDMETPRHEGGSYENISELQTEPLTKDIGHDDTETGEYSNILNVYIARSPGQSLGISIVGGNEEALSKGIIGIFVRTIVEDSPAGCENGLKVNDRILELNDQDLRNASHDVAVEAIRNATSPMEFVVERLVEQALLPLEGSAPFDWESEGKGTFSVNDDNQETQDDTLEVELALAGTNVVESSFLQENEKDEIEALREKYPDVAGELYTVDLVKGELGLGLSIAGGRGATANRIFVVDVKPNGAAFHDGKIKAMDEILEVNHVTIRGISHHDASAILRNTPTHVHLALGRTKEGANYLKRRSAAARDSALISERAHSPSLEQYASNASLNKQTPSPLVVTDESESQRDSPVPQMVTQEHSEPPPQTVVSLLKSSLGLGFAIGEGPSHLFGEQGICIKSITPGGVAEQVWKTVISILQSTTLNGGK